MSESVFDAFLRERLTGVYRRVRGRKTGRSLVRPDFARRVDLEERKRHFQTVHPDPIPTARESHALVLPSPMLQHIMEVTDSMSSAFAIETRCPFLDRRLIEFSLAIPSEQKLADGWTRLILRKAMQGILPPEIQWRLHKADLAYNFVRRLQNDDRQILDSLFDQPEVLADYVDMNELRDLHTRFYSNGLKGARHKSAHLYIAAVLARWLRARGADGPLHPIGPPA
jgi:asparagine synthase (glutamine-hydrolysing)